MSPKKVKVARSAEKVKRPKPSPETKKKKSISPEKLPAETQANDEVDNNDHEIERPKPGYLNKKQIKLSIGALKDYITKSKALKLSCAQRKNLLEAGEKNPSGLAKVIVEVVFKNIPANSRTYIHNVVLPNHWRLKLEPEDCNIAIFVKHRRPESEAQKIQFSRDRDLDMENTHSFYKDLFQQKLDDNLNSRISRIITSKEVATEFNTFQKLDRLSKTFDMFLSDKQLMANRMNPLPRRLGRRFWVREKKVPLLVKLDSKNLNERFERVLSIEPFYVLGRSASEKLQIGLISQSDAELAENMAAFLKKLHELYKDSVRFIRLRTDWGVALPLYADLSTTCPKVVMHKKRIKIKPVVDSFDLVGDDTKVSVHADGTVEVLRPKRKQESTPEKPVKRIKRVKKIA